MLTFGTIIISLLSGASEKIKAIFKDVTENPNYIIWFIIALVLLFFIFMTKNFAEKQKSIIFAKRKIIILRRMLGMDYGAQEFLFKKGMLEGANMPFSIKLSFNYLYHIIPILCVTALLIIIHMFLGYSLMYAIVFNSIIIIALYLFYICCILDINETILLVIIRILFSRLGINFVDNFEHVLYRAKLSAYECKRQKIDLDNLKKILVAIEDQKFYQHKGVDFKALCRALLSRGRKIPFFNKISFIKNIPFTGGSTITQQLFRTLFIENMNKKRYRRKIAEILLSYLWFNKILSKEEQLEIYLSAIRFDKKIFGIMQAMRHFYGGDKYIKNLSKAQSFFLIERVSVTSGTMLPKVIDTIVRLEKEKILNKEDIEDIIKIYTKAQQDNKITVFFKNRNILEELSKKYKHQN